MLVEIDVDQLVRDAATMIMDNEWKHETSCIVNALQKQIATEPRLALRVRQQVKEYKKLTMWRD